MPIPKKAVILPPKTKSTVCLYEKKLTVFVALMLFAFGTQQMFAQSSFFQREERQLICDENEGLDRHGGTSGGGGENPPPGSPLGSGIAILLGLSAGYAYFKRKGEE